MAPAIGISKMARIKNEELTIPLLSEVTCPHCWEVFAPKMFCLFPITTTCWGMLGWVKMPSFGSCPPDLIVVANRLIHWVM